MIYKIKPIYNVADYEVAVAAVSPLFDILPLQLQQALNVRCDVTREALLLLNRSQPARKKKVFLGSRTYGSVFLGQRQRD